MNRHILIGVVAGAALTSVAFTIVNRIKPVAVPSALLEAPATIGAKVPRKILYYRNPMGLDDRSPVPKKDSMGMDYVPVYADEPETATGVRIPTDQLQKFGVRSEKVVQRTIARAIRIAATVEADETRLSTVAPKFEGWVTRLYVASTGHLIRRGQPLADVYSPDLESALGDYRVSLAAANATGEADATVRGRFEKLVARGRERLHRWDLTDADIDSALSQPARTRSVMLRAKTDGVVIEKTARVGGRFAVGESLYQVADLSTVWVVGAVFEQDLPDVRVGQSVRVVLVGERDRTRIGKVEFLAPVLKSATRTAELRVRVANPDRTLKPGMFGTLIVDSPEARPALAVPGTAILETGARQLVLVDLGDGRFEPRAVDIGVRGEHYTEITRGLSEGERVVVDGNFLIDSESSLRGLLRAPVQHGGNSREGV